MLHVHVSVSFAKYGTLTALHIFGHKRGAHEFVGGDRSFWGYASLARFGVMIFPSFMVLYGHCLRTITSVDVRN